MGDEMFWDNEIDAAPEAGQGGEATFDAVAFGARLREARVRAGLNQTQAAAGLGVSQPTYSRMEQGRVEAAKVTSTLLDQASRLLGRSMSWLLMGSPVRDRIRLAARRTDEGEVRDRAHRVLDLLEMDAEFEELQALIHEGDPPEATDGYAQTPAAAPEPQWTALQRQAPGHPSRRQGKDLAEELRAALGLGSGPIEDLPAVLERTLGVDVAVVPLGEGLSAVLAFDDARTVALIAVNVDEPYVRQRFSFAHEVAHLLYSEGHVENHGASRSPAEIRADKFAQHFLLPERGILDWLAARGHSRPDRVPYSVACALADEFGVSPKTAWIALDDLRIAPREAAPTTATAAVVLHNLAKHQAREASRRVQRVPARMEERFLDSFRSGLLSAAATADLLGQDPAILLEVEGAAAPARADGGMLVAT